MNKMKRKKLMAEDEPSMTYTQKKWKTSEGILLTLLHNKDYDIWKEARLGHGSRQSHREKILIAAWVKHLLEIHKKSCEFCDEPPSEHNYSKSSGIRNKTNRKLQSNAAEPVSVQRSCSDQLHVSEEVKQMPHVDVCDQENLELRQAGNNTGDTPNCLEDNLTADVVKAASGVTDCTKLIEDEVSTAEADRKTSISIQNSVFEHSNRDNCEDEVSVTMREDKCKDITSVSIKQEKQPSTAPTVNNTKKGPAQCPVCHKIFKGKDQLEWHIRRHTGNRPYKCDECQATFISPYNLKAHKKLHNPERPYCCEECGKSFQSKYVYREHLIIHSGSKPYMCTKCAKGFAARSSLAKHMVMHDAGSRDHLCVHCGKAFRHKEHLRRHVLYAHREKKESKKEHVCNICGKAFNRPYLLKIHTRVHSGERPYKCSICGKDYKLSRQLKEHEGVHLGIKLYHCSLCGKHFQHSSTLCKHKRSCQGKDDTNKPGVHVAEKAFMMVQLETSEDGDGCVSHKESQQSTEPEPDSETDLVQSQDVNMYKGYWCSECSELYVQESAYAEHMKITHGVEAITQNQQVSLFVTAD